MSLSPLPFSSQSIPAIHPELVAAAQKRIDGKTKPLGALGRLENLAVRLAGIQNRECPSVTRRSMVIFAADHGLAAEGVSAFPQEVTWQMVGNFAQGGAAINVLCRQYQIDLHVVDVGVMQDTIDLPGVQQLRVGPGTRNCLHEPAMSPSEAQAALAAGARVVADLQRGAPLDLLGLGEMGIGNSSAAVLIIAALCGQDPGTLAGRGTGLNDPQLEHKRAVLRAVWQRHGLEKIQALQLLECVGGFEIAAIAGAVIAAAQGRIPVMLDGLISTAGGLLAEALCPGVKNYIILSHRSAEAAHAHAVSKLGIEPLLDLGLRLGEGSGAAIAISLADAACAIQGQMASFASAGVSERS